MKARRLLGPLSMVILVASGSAQQIVPVAVSPGSESGVAVVSLRCPTFSWSSIPWGVGYRVAAFEMAKAEIKTYEAIAAEAIPVLAKEIHGQALSWTPSARERLKDGGLYIWYVQVLDSSENGFWSEGKLFKVEVEGTFEQTEEGSARIQERVGRRLREIGVSNEVITDVEKEIKSLADGLMVASDHPPHSAGQSSSKMVIQGLEDENNTFFGFEAGLLTAEAYNTFIGSRAGYTNSMGHENTFMGQRAGYGNSIESYNTFVGCYAGVNSRTGSYNTLLGYHAGYENQGGTSTFVGSNAGYYNAGAYNTFIGADTGTNNSTGYYNTFLGWKAGNYNTTGYQNTFIGQDAGQANRTGIYNAFLGARSGFNSMGGSQNTFLGMNAGYSNTTGSYNTFVGKESGWSNSTGAGNVCLGYKAGYYETGSNKLYVDNSSTSSPLIFGNFSTDYLVFNGKVGIKKKSPPHLLDVGTSGAYCNGGAWVDGSSREYKENIRKLTAEEALRAFWELEPVKYNYKSDKKEQYLGFIAEDVPELVAMKDRKGLSTMDVVAVLTKVVQEQQDTIKELQKRIMKLEKKAKSET